MLRPVVSAGPLCPQIFFIVPLCPYADTLGRFLQSILVHRFIIFALILNRSVVSACCQFGTTDTFHCFSHSLMSAVFSSFHFVRMRTFKVDHCFLLCPLWCGTVSYLNIQFFMILFGLVSYLIRLNVYSPCESVSFYHLTKDLVHGKQIQKKWSYQSKTLKIKYQINAFDFVMITS